MVVLLIVSFAGPVLVLYGADRVLKARAQVRRRRTMSDRLAAAVTRAEDQQEQRQAAAQASAALTSVIPAIKRPPLTLPGEPSHGAARPRAGCERTGRQDHGSAHASRRPSRTGEHPARSADRPGRGSDQPDRPADPGERKGHLTGPRRPVS